MIRFVPPRQIVAPYNQRVIVHVVEGLVFDLPPTPPALVSAGSCVHSVHCETSIRQAGASDAHEVSLVIIIRISSRHHDGGGAVFSSSYACCGGGVDSVS